MEGLNFGACNAIISDFQVSLDSVIGLGIPIDEPLPVQLSPLPWWLLAVTALMLLNLVNDIQHSLSCTTIAITHPSLEQQQNEVEQQHLQQIDKQHTDDVYFTKLTIDRNQKIIDHCNSDLSQLESKIIDPTVSEYNKTKLRDLKEFQQRNLKSAQQELAAAQEKLHQLQTEEE